MAMVGVRPVVVVVASVDAVEDVEDVRVRVLVGRSE